MAATDVRVVLGLLDARTLAGDDGGHHALKALGAGRLACAGALPAARAARSRAGSRDGPRRAGPPARARPQGVLRRAARPHGPACDQRVLGHRRPARRAASRPRPCCSTSATRCTASSSRPDRPADPPGAGAGGRRARISPTPTRCCGRSPPPAARSAWPRGHLAHRRADHPVAPEARLQAADRAPARAQLRWPRGSSCQDGEAVLAAEARPDRDPVLILRAAAAAAQAGIPLGRHAVTRLAAESAPMPVPWPAPRAGRPRVAARCRTQAVARLGGPGPGGRDRRPDPALGGRPIGAPAQPGAPLHRRPPPAGGRGPGLRVRPRRSSGPTCCWWVRCCTTSARAAPDLDHTEVGVGPGRRDRRAPGLLAGQTPRRWSTCAGITCCSRRPPPAATSTTR